MKQFNFFMALAIAMIISNYSASAQSKLSPRLQKKIQVEKSENYTVWIFFTDKGTELSAKLKTADQSLPANARKRREKSMTGKSIVNHRDIPVNNEYINALNIPEDRLRHASRWLNAVSADLTETKITQIEALPFVQRIDLVYKAKKDYALNHKAIPANTGGGKSFNYGNSYTQMQQINVPAAHDMGYTGNGLIVCVMDAGFNNLEHPVFSDLTILGAYDFVNDDENVDDEGDMGTGNHGTQTLSSLAGFYEGQLIGPAFGASYILAKTENTDSETPIEEDHWVAALEWAEYNWGPDVTSTSLGYSDWYTASDMDGNTATITIAADIAAGYGILVVNSAGNEGGGTTTISAPADGDSVMAVGAVDSNGDRVSFSSVGPTADGRIKPEVMAMGTGVVVAETYGSGYTTASGTSFSCPITAGAATLLWEMVPEASNMEIFEALKQTADNSDSPNNEYGWGIIDIMAAYEYLRLPQISHEPLSDTEDQNGPYPVSANVVSYTDLTASSPTLYYRYEMGSWESVFMENTTEDTYTANIPGNGDAGVYDYYITAENQYEAVSLPDNAPTEFYSFTTGPDVVAPLIEHQSINEYYINLWGQAKVVCHLEDNFGISLSDSHVEWKLNGSDQNNLAFYTPDNQVFNAYFDNANIQIGDFIEYRIVAADQAQTPNITTFPESGFHSFYITDIISFEQNAFSHNWEFSGEAEWTITAGGANSTNYAAVSGDIDDNQTSSISIEFEAAESGELSFYKKVSSEDGWDYLKFFINGNMQDEWSGEESWSQETYNLSAGSHTLTWTYDKDFSISNGSDCAWIDMISLPGTVFTSVDKQDSEHTIRVFPNPATNRLYIQSESNDVVRELSIWDMNGRHIKTKINESVIDISAFPAGMYFIRIQTDSTVLTNKFIKK